jgi:hypothetical protein
MKVFVKTMTGKVQAFKTEDSVLDLKRKISEDGFTMESLQLIYGGKMLDDSNTLSQHGIIDDSCVHLRLSLRGGMFHPTSSKTDYTSLKTASLTLDIYLLEQILSKLKTP